MIRLGLRLTLNAGREAVVRLVAVAVAVALGVAMVLITLSGINGVNAQSGRFAWLSTGAAGPAAAGATSGDWWLLSGDEYHGREIGRVDLAPIGPRPPVPPGIPRLPRAGEIYASPALAALLRTTPAAQLGDRYPGRVVGTIGTAALPSPQSLIAVVGRTPAQLAHQPGAEHVTAIQTGANGPCNGICGDIGVDSNGMELILGVATAALLFPLLIFIGTAARLAAARREQRFAAMRLVGAVPRQITIVAAVESTVASVLGVVAGFGLFLLLRPAVAGVPFTGQRFFVSDLSLNLPQVLVVALGVPVAAAVAARVALRRVTVSPLGVSRRATPPRPRAARLLPLAVGLGLLWYFVVAGRPQSTQAQILAYVSAILIVMAGLVIAGPWLTMVGSRVMARRTSRPAVLLAARRLGDNPHAAFRAVSGVTVALFVATMATASVTAIAPEGVLHAPAVARSTVVDDFDDIRLSGAVPADLVDAPWAAGQARIQAVVPAGLPARLRAVPGVRGTVLVRGAPPSVQVVDGRQDLSPRAVVSCAELAAVPAIGRCPAGAAVADISDWFAQTETATTRVWPVAATSAAAFGRLPARGLAVATDGSRAAVETVRTVLEQAYPYLYAPATIAETAALTTDARLDTQFRQLADVVLLATLPIAGCSLAVAVVAGLADRRRPFSLLRLAGAPLGALRRVVALETVVPLLVTALLSIGVSFLATGLFLRSQLGDALRAPELGYYLTVGAGLLAALAIMTATLPLLTRLTGPDAARDA